MKKTAIEDIYPLSPMQAGILFHALYNRDSKAYMDQIAYRVHGALDVDLLEKAWNRLGRRHDILRTAFVHEDTAHPLQVLLKTRKIEFHQEDLAALPATEQEIHLQQRCREERERPYDFTRDPLLRIRVFRLSAQEFEVAWSFHHIILDGWSLGIIQKEIGIIYDALIGNKTPALPPTTPYRAYIKWLETRDHEASLTYWKAYLAGYTRPPRHLAEKTATGEYRLEEYIFTLPDTSALHQIASANQCTLSSVIQALWAMVVSKYTARDEIVFGSVVSGRPAEVPGIENMVGLFINTLPVRVGIDRGVAFAEFVRTIQQNANASALHHYTPLADIQAQHELKEELFDHILVFQNYPVQQGPHTSGDAALRISGVGIVEETGYDLNVIVSSGAILSIRLNYNANVYHRDFIVQKLAGFFLELAQAVAADAQVRIGRICVASSAERAALAAYRAAGIDSANRAAWPVSPSGGVDVTREPHPMPESIAGILLNYWRRQLGNGFQSLQIPTDHPRPAIPTFTDASVAVDFPRPLILKTRDFSQAVGVSLYAVLLAAFKSLLQRYSGQEEIVTGMRFPNTTHPDVAPAVGPFENLLVLRDRFDGDISFRKLTQAVEATVYDACAHGELPLDELLTILNAEKDRGGTAPLNVLFDLDETGTVQPDSDARPGEPIADDFASGRYDLNMRLWETARGLNGLLFYNRDLFDEKTAKRLAGHYVRLCEAALDQADAPIGGLDFLEATEYRMLVKSFNDTATTYPRDRTITALFEEQVAKTPDNIAVVYADVGLTYGELNRRANRIGHYLRETWQLRPDERVAVLLKRSDWMIAALLGVLKAGGAYVPIDSSYPEARIQFMLQDSGCRLLLTEAEYLTSVSRSLSKGPLRDTPIVDIHAMPLTRSTNGALIAHPDDTAYVIYIGVHWQAEGVYGHPS